jgi:hypothetical protein
MDFILGDLAYENDCSTLRDLTDHLRGYIFLYQAIDTFQLMILFSFGLKDDSFILMTIISLEDSGECMDIYC